MRLIDSLLHIVVFVAIFSNIISAPENYTNGLNRNFTDSNKDLKSYVKLKAKFGEPINIPIVCLQSTPQTQEKQNETDYKYSIIYRVESREEFDNCIVDADKKVATVKCNESNPSETEKFRINIVDFSPVPDALEFEKDKEYYFISGPKYRLDGLCDGIYLRISITVEAQNQTRLPLSDDKNDNKLISLMGKSSSTYLTLSLILFLFSILLSICLSRFLL